MKKKTVDACDHLDLWCLAGCRISVCCECGAWREFMGAWNQPDKASQWVIASIKLETGGRPSTPAASRLRRRK